MLLHGGSLDGVVGCGRKEHSAAGARCYCVPAHLGAHPWHPAFRVVAERRGTYGVGDAFKEGMAAVSKVVLGAFGIF